MLARWPLLTNLAVLNLHGNRIGDVGAYDFASSAHLGGIREVDLSGNQIGPEGVKALRCSPLGQTVRVSMNLNRNIRDDGIHA